MLQGKDKMLFTEDILMAPLTEMVCYCSNVTKGRIMAAIQEGAHHLEDIKAATGACTAGKCKELSPRKR
jgi:NAD(P)H-nitrite reductase large subunit